MKTIEELTADIAAGRPLEVADVVDAIDRYPYFTLPALTLLRQPDTEIDEELRRRLATLAAVNTTDTSDRVKIAGEAAFSPEEPFYPDEIPAKVNTNDAIDTFLTTYGTMSPEEDALLERMIFNPTPDYSQILDREEKASVPSEGEATPGSDDDLINSFIIKQKKQTGEIPDTPAPAPRRQEPIRTPSPKTKKPVDNTPLSLSLAKIFIKQRHYERAYEIISQLNLNYPEKSVYFADQLRFLQKVIAIQKRKNSKNQ